MELIPDSPKKEALKRVSGGACLSSILSLEHEAADVNEIGTEKDVENLVKRYADKFGFKKISKTGGVHTSGMYGPIVHTFGTEGYIEKIDGRWRTTMCMDKLLVTPKNIERLGKTYRMWPDLASSVIEFGIMHERFESYLNKTIDKQIEIGMTKYSIDEMGVSEKDEKRLAVGFASAYSARARRDSQANLGVAVSLLDFGMDPELLKEKIAAFVWYVKTHPAYDLFDRMPKNEREAKIREMTDCYLDYNFSWLKQKGEVIEKAINVDREYRKRLREDLNIAYQ